MTEIETFPADVPARLAAVSARVGQAARDVGRAPETVSLVAVSKTHAPR